MKHAFNVSEAFLRRHSNIVAFSVSAKFNRKNPTFAGLSICGGIEHGLGVFVSETKPDSAAERSGLRVGDEILSVNGVDFLLVTCRAAAKVMGGSERKKLRVNRVAKIPVQRCKREKIAWSVDVCSNDERALAVI